ncbi:Interleukin enhancer-binding factor 2-like protein [Frankliniella fusca]|uniref:Interleukin enhancer-binding factor 2-like protein n=1 Tax=Frankliniella fusca TaxID=407009 RepID=A0AAE1H5T3_9NEOP|nr:Interleukin enhancer-binding factor 2-like protein [Frankliniella fusca]
MPEASSGGGAGGRPVRRPSGPSRPRHGRPLLAAPRPPFSSTLLSRSSVGWILVPKFFQHCLPEAYGCLHLPLPPRGVPMDLTAAI